MSCARKALAFLFFLLMLVGNGLFTRIGGTSTPPQETETVQMIDNGGFEEAVPADALGAFWLVSGGRGRLGIPTSVTTEVARTGSHTLRLTLQDESIYQYLPALEELANRTTLAGSVLVSSGSGGAPSALRCWTDMASRNRGRDDR